MRGNITIVEDTAVNPAGAVLGERDGRTIIVVDPALPRAERDALVEELLGA